MADGGFRRSLKRHVADVENIAGDDQNRSKFRKYENLCLRDQAKRLEKLLFLLRTMPRLTALHTVNFPAITRNGFCFHIRKIISRPPEPAWKNRNKHIVDFFLVDSIYSTTIDIILKNILFSIFKHMCISGPPADSPNL